MSATPERDAQLLEVGKQCSASSCMLVDFLPFKCQHCAEPFCGEHFLPTAHTCPKYDAAKHDRVAPPCKCIHVLFLGLKLTMSQVPFATFLSPFHQVKTRTYVWSDTSTPSVLS